MSDDILELISLYNECLADNIKLPVFVTSDHNDMTLSLSDCFCDSFLKVNVLISIKYNLNFLKD